jgi:hypothetical protein
MSMLAEQYEFVIGGDPDRDTVDLAVVESATGALRAHLADRADGAGYARMLAWADDHAPGRRVWALEGTGSFAAGFAVFLAEADEQVVEIGGLKRHRGAKNDRIDAVRAARQALAREHQTNVRGHGLREALRMIVTTRQAILVSRTKAINEMKSLIVVAPEQLRADLRGYSLAKQLDRIEQMSSRVDATVEHKMAVLTLRSTGFVYILSYDTDSPSATTSSSRREALTVTTASRRSAALRPQTDAATIVRPAA